MLQNPPALPSDSEWRPMLTSPFAMYRFRKAKATITAHRTQVNHLARLTGLTGLWDDEGRLARRERAAGDSRHSGVAERRPQHRRR